VPDPAADRCGPPPTTWPTCALHGRTRKGYLPGKSVALSAFALPLQVDETRGGGERVARGSPTGGRGGTPLHNKPRRRRSTGPRSASCRCFVRTPGPPRPPDAQLRLALRPGARTVTPKHVSTARNGNPTNRRRRGPVAEAAWARPALRAPWAGAPRTLVFTFGRRGHLEYAPRRFLAEGAAAYSAAAPHRGLRRRRAVVARAASSKPGARGRCGPCIEWPRRPELESFHLETPSTGNSPWVAGCRGPGFGGGGPSCSSDPYSFPHRIRCSPISPRTIPAAGAGPAWRAPGGVPAGAELRIAPHRPGESLQGRGGRDALPLDVRRACSQWSSLGRIGPEMAITAA